VSEGQNMQAVGFTEFGGPEVLGIVAHGVRGRLILAF